MPSACVSTFLTRGPYCCCVSLPIPLAVAQPVPSCARLLGVINSVLLVPVCISFATIIYRDPFFANHLPMLVKLVLFSALVHQAIFTACSTLPFAIGQVLRT